jgi:hypothetical protein
LPDCQVLFAGGLHIQASPRGGQHSSYRTHCRGVPPEAHPRSHPFTPILHCIPCHPARNR